MCLWSPCRGQWTRHRRHRVIVLTVSVCLLLGSGLRQGRCQSTSSDWDRDSGTATGLLDSPEPLDPSQLRIGSFVGGGVNVFSHRYREPGLMEQSGTFWGFLPRYWYRTERLRIGLWAVFPARGRVTYEGSLADIYTGEITPITRGGITDIQRQIVATVGRIVHPRGRWTIIPYSGVGFRHLTDDPSDFPGGYIRRSFYLYLPVGVELEHWLTPAGWSIHPAAEFEYIWFGEQKSYVKEPFALAGLAIPNVKNKQRGGWGARLSLTLENQQSYGPLSMTAHIQYWKLPKSDISTVRAYENQYSYYVFSFYEPKNNTVEFGLTLGIAFRIDALAGG